MKKLLYGPNSAVLQPLLAHMERLDRRTLILWALDCATCMLELYAALIPGDARPAEALAAANRWACGEIKMPEARTFIFSAHRAAREAGFSPAAEAAARAVAQAASTVHTPQHAPGLLYYGLTAISLSSSPQDKAERVEQLLFFFADRLEYWEHEAAHTERQWAPFLSRHKRLDGTTAK